MPYTTLRSPLSALAPLVLMLILGGCTASPGVRAEGASLPEAWPADFTLGVVVYCNHPWKTLEECPARYIIEADGTMRVSAGEGSGPLTHPPIARRLGRETLGEVWSLTRGLSMFTPDAISDQSEDGRHPGRVQSPETYAPAEGKGYLIEIRGGGDRQAWTMPKDDPTAHELVRRLAELSWIRE
ncbi:MAG: hypothetical protein WD114_05485 [Phycisphaerales bacterium]